MKSFPNFLAFVLVFTIQMLPQNIDAKLGSGGTFSVLNSSNSSILSISETNNNLNLTNLNIASTIGSNAGIIYKNGLRIFHTFGNNNLFLGYNAGNFTLSNSSNANVGVGTGTLAGLTTGFENTAVGNVALNSVTSGKYNSAFGSFALQPNTAGDYNSAFGYSSLRSNTVGNDNAAFGVAALYSNTTGHDNAAFGNSSLNLNTTGFFNSAFGMNALRKNNGDENSAFGQAALFENTTGYDNSAFGVQALQNNTTGFQNTAVGVNAGNIVTTGSNLVLLGVNSNPSSPTAVNEVTLGNSATQTLRCNTTTITSLSDARDKKNIKDLSLGLNFLMKIHPREFNWDRREWYDNGVADGTKMQETPTAGFIAQELDQIQTEAEAEWLNLVLKENPDRIEATPHNLFPVVVKAIQDLKTEKDTEIASLKSQNEQLRKEISELKEVQMRLAKLEQMMNSVEVKFSSNTGE